MMESQESRRAETLDSIQHDLISDNAGNDTILKWLTLLKSTERQEAEVLDVIQNYQRVFNEPAQLELCFRSFHSGVSWTRIFESAQELVAQALIAMELVLRNGRSQELSRFLFTRTRRRPSCGT